jgi:hypothetical protein
MYVCNEDKYQMEHPDSCSRFEAEPSRNTKQDISLQPFSQFDFPLFMPTRESLLRPACSFCTFPCYYHSQKHQSRVSYSLGVCTSLWSIFYIIPIYYKVQYIKLRAQLVWKLRCRMWDSILGKDKRLLPTQRPVQWIPRAVLYIYIYIYIY